MSPARSTIEGSRSQSNLRGARLIQVSDLELTCQLETWPPVPQIVLVSYDEDTSWEGRRKVASVAKPNKWQSSRESESDNI